MKYTETSKVNLVLSELSSESRVNSSNKVELILTVGSSQLTPAASTSSPPPPGTSRLFFRTTTSASPLRSSPVLSCLSPSQRLRLSAAAAAKSSLNFFFLSQFSSSGLLWLPFSRQRPRCLRFSVSNQSISRLSSFTPRLLSYCLHNGRPRRRRLAPTAARHERRGLRKWLR